MGVTDPDTKTSILNQIKAYQNEENDIIRKLENNPDLLPGEKQSLVKRIKQLTDLRSDLYKSLRENTDYYTKILTASDATLLQQTAAANIVESELDRAKKRLEYLEMEKNNKVRLVEINEYYGDKYSEHSTLMKIVIFTLIPIIILTIIYNKGFLPSRIYYILFIITGVIGAYYFWKTYGSIITRDNMNYNEYSWSFDKKNAPKGSGKVNDDPWMNKGIGSCMNSDCCSSDQIYNSANLKCETKTASNKV